MANRFTIELPDGRKLTVEADDQAAAIKGAQEWFSANGKPAAPAEQQGPPVPQQNWLQRAGRTADDAARLIANGATFGFADKLAGMTGDVKDERAKTQESRDRMGWTGTALEVGSGIGTGVGLAKAGLTTARAIPSALSGGSRLAATIGAGAVDGAALGALGAVGNTDNLQEMTGNVAGGALIGAGAGAAAPALVAGVGKLFQPARDAIANIVSPESVARRMATNAMDRANMTPDQIRASLDAARAAGQSDYLAVDAMGDGGRRALNAVARGNSPAASRIKDILDARQAGQADRVEGIIREGLDAPTTGEALIQKLTGIRSEKGAQQYGAARAAAGPVDVGPAVAALNEAIPPVTAAQATARGVSESGPVSAVERARRLLTNEPIGGPAAQPAPQMPAGLTPLQRAQWLQNPPQAAAAPRTTSVDDFSRALLAKQEMDAALEQGGTVAGMMRPARNALDQQLANASAPYGKARDTYRNISQAIEAVDTGRDLARRSALSQDVGSTFKGMSAQEQGAARYGYADELIKRIQSAREGIDKTLPLTSGKLADDLAVVGKRDVGDKLAREMDMAATRRVATQGSNTAQNLADMGLAAGAGGMLYMNPTSPEGVLAAAFAARRGLARIPPSEAAREELVRALLSRTPDNLASMAAKQAKARAVNEDVVNPIVRALLMSGGAAVAQ